MAVASLGVVAVTNDPEDIRTSSASTNFTDTTYCDAARPLNGTDCFAKGVRGNNGGPALADPTPKSNANPRLAFQNFAFIMNPSNNL